MRQFSYLNILVSGLYWCQLVQILPCVIWVHVRSSSKYTLCDSFIPVNVKQSFFSYSYMFSVQYKRWKLPLGVRVKPTGEGFHRNCA